MFGKTGVPRVRQLTALATVAPLVLLIACAGTRYHMVYSSGFSFTNYDYLVIEKVSANTPQLTGMDIEFGNLMARYNMNVIGQKEYETLSDDKKRRALVVRLAGTASGKRNVLSVSFDDEVTGKTVATISRQAKGDLLDEDKRTQALEQVADVVVRQISKEKGLQTTSRDEAGSERRE